MDAAERSYDDGYVFKPPEGWTPEMESQWLYQIAAEWGHDEAINALIEIILSERDEGLLIWADVLAKSLIDRGIPAGYYHMSRLQTDNRRALVYLRKAADLGSPVAQAKIAENLLKFYLYEKHPGLSAIALQMARCAAEQGDARAASIIVAIEKIARFGNTSPPPPLPSEERITEMAQKKILFQNVGNPTTPRDHADDYAEPGAASISLSAEPENPEPKSEASAPDDSIEE